jgi:hypothetical protein
MSSTTLTDKEAVCAIMRRCRKTGGVPIKEVQVQQFQAWFRTLARRGYVTSAFLRDADVVKRTFKGEFTNGMTRGQYVRSVLTFFSGLNDEDFSLYFPDLNRERTVNLLLEVGSEGTRDHRKRLADKRDGRTDRTSAFEQGS